MVKACPSCGYVNNGIDSKCANCYAPLPERDEPVRRKRKLFDLSIQKICLGLIALTWLLCFLLGGGNWTAKDDEADLSRSITAPEPGWEQKDSSGLAYIMMCDFIRERCLTPALAGFPSIDDGEVTVKKIFGTTYSVSGYVITDNAFNESIKTRFSGQIREIVPANWKLITMQIDDPGVLMPPPK